jgi:RimJ/RimL family protein N-acetyltransferase
MNQRLTLEFPLSSPRFYLRDLTLADVSDVYLAWMNDSIAMQFIESSSETRTINNLINYLENRINKDNVRFFGIFCKKTNLHIGNIKYEPIDFEDSYAIMGVLIGDKLFRGVGAFGEVYSTSSRYIAHSYGIKTIYAGVDRNNISAIQAYKKNGFVIADVAPVPVPSTNLMFCNTA